MDAMGIYEFGEALAWPKCQSDTWAGDAVMGLRDEGIAIVDAEGFVDVVVHTHPGDSFVVDRYHFRDGSYVDVFDGDFYVDVFVDEWKPKDYDYRRVHCPGF